MHQNSLFAHRTVALSERQREVLEVFADGEEYTDHDIAESLGWEINRVTGRIKELIEAHRLDEMSEKVYINNRPRRKCRIVY